LYSLFLGWIYLTTFFLPEHSLCKKSWHTLIRC
jgi:hypothetical protein